MQLRAKYKERFAQVHGSSLGLMSFFSRAAVLALGEFPAINAQIDGTHIVYHDFVNLGIAVSTERGLVVPVLHRTDQMSIAQLESNIKRLALECPRQQASHGRTKRRHLYHHQRRSLRLTALHADSQRAAKRHPGNARDPRAARGRRRPSGNPADDVRGAVL